VTVARPNADIHGSPERVPGAFFRAMGALYFKGRPDSSEESLARDLGRRLAACGIEYHFRTLERQLTGAVSSVPPEVEVEMCRLLTGGNGLRTLCDIEHALAAAGLGVGPGERVSPYVPVDRLVPLARLWLHLNSGKSKRFLARRLRDELSGGDVPYSVDALQVILGGKRHRVTRSIVYEKLLALLAENGVASEEEARSRYLDLAEEIAASVERRKVVGSQGFVRLCRLWQLRHHEPSSRQLALMLRQRLAEGGVPLSLPHLQNLVSARTRGVRRGVLQVLEELTRQELHKGETLEQEVARVFPRMADLGWVKAESVAALAREWVARRPGVSPRQLALRLADAVRRMGYPSSHNSIQPILGGWKKKARRFVYRAMLVLMEERPGSVEEPRQVRCLTKGCVFPAAQEGLCRQCWLGKHDFRAFERRSDGFGGV